MRASALVVLVAACSSSSSRAPRGAALQEIPLPGANRDIRQWEAWSLDVRSNVLGVAPAFGRPGVAIDLVSGQVHETADEDLLDSDRPLWFDRASNRCSDGVSTLLPCANEAGFHRDVAAFARLAPGAIVILGLDTLGQVGLSAWTGASSPAWRYAPPRPAGAGGVAVAVNELSLALVSGSDEGPTSVAVLDPATGAPRWSTDIDLRLRTWPALFQPVAFVDSDRGLVVTGRAGGSDRVLVLDAASGQLVSSFDVEGPIAPSSDNLHTWIGVKGGVLWLLRIQHVRRPEHPMWEDTPDHWECEYRAYRKGNRAALVDTSRDEREYRAMFGANPRDCAVRVGRPLGDGGLILISVTTDGLRVARWAEPPGVR